jgi:2,5-diketo-D-gluconate reductase A
MRTALSARFSGFSRGGTDQIPPEQTQAAVTIALQAGCRHIDTAAAYCNEAETGDAIAASSLPRDELFVTTKVWNNDQGGDRTRAPSSRVCPSSGSTTSIST